MSHTLTEVSEFTASVPVPDNADRTYVTVVPQMAQALANRTKFHEDSLSGDDAAVDTIDATGGTEFLLPFLVPKDGRADLLRNGLLNLNNKINWVRDRLFGTSRYAADTIAWVPTLTAFNASDWTPGAYTSSTITAGYIRQSTKGANYAVFNVPDLPAHLYIRQLKVTVSSPVSHSGSFPQTMPRIALVSISSAGAATEIAGQVDTSSTIGAYEAVHDITATFTYNTKRNDALALHIRGEDGADGEDNSFRVFRASLQVYHEP